MATSRCVRLMLISMANDLKEVWIADHPFLLVVYLWQYMPTWAWWLTNILGKKRIENFKNGLVRPIYTILNQSCSKVWHFLVLENFLVTLHHDVRIVSPMQICWFTINYYWSWRKKFLQGKKSYIAILSSTLPDWLVYVSEYSFAPVLHHKFLPHIISLGCYLASPPNFSPGHVP